MYKYVNTNTGQVVESQVRRADLARLSRWDETKVEAAAEPAAAEPASKPAKPARKSATKTAKPE
ncbi:hypothetical protein [Gulosibacter hominis]|uniref:hypothetical protein n=1 Tax=Gulosibacter hominis TaxID=2770504 RepID=UPI0019189513|nr:hypothetical protein [Gulosibacter hominis]